MTVPDSIEFLSEKAYDAERRQDWHAAAMAWDQVRTAFPDDVTGHLRLAAVLCQSRRFEAADAVLGPALVTFADDPAVAVEFARVAHIRADWPEALERWQRLLTAFPANADGVSGASVALAHLGRLDEAETLLTDGTGQFPDDPGAAVEFARAPHRRRDWPEALHRWDIVKERFPDIAEGYAGAGSALTHLDRLDEADAVLGAAVARFPEHNQTLIEYGRVAHCRRDWPEALHRWEIACARFPGSVDGFLGAATALRALERLDDWNSVASEAMKRFPGNAAVAVGYAEAAHQLGDWPEAIRRWEDARARFPDNQAIQEGLGQSIFRANLDRLDQGEDRTQGVAAASPSALTPADLMARFEGLGSGCEFGLVQRHFGAEPLGLLRWGAIPAEKLADMLNAKLANVGNPESVEMFAFGESREFFFRDKRYSLEMHTFIPARPDEYTRVLSQQIQRAQFLARKLLEDLATGDKIYLYKRHVGTLSDAEAYPIYRALRQYGRHALLCVVPADPPAFPGGTVVVRDEGLLFGYVDALSPTSSAAEIRYDSWEAVLRAAYNVWRDPVSA
jgi:tetratricopeptide (TPR) repeat protein